MEAIAAPFKAPGKTRLEASSSPSPRGGAALHGLKGGAEGKQSALRA